jgi:alpha-mannosidase
LALLLISPVLPGSFNLPTISLSGDKNSGIVLETIKRGEDDEANGNKTVLLRLYEGKGGRAKATLKMYVSASSLHKQGVLADGLVRVSKSSRLSM